MSSVRNEQDSDVEKIYQNEQHPINDKNQKRTYTFITFAVLTNLVIFLYRWQTTIEICLLFIALLLWSCIGMRSHKMWIPIEIVGVNGWLGAYKLKI